MALTSHKLLRPSCDCRKWVASYGITIIQSFLKVGQADEKRNKNIISRVHFVVQFSRLFYNSYSV
jgi:archaellum component FlaF (FlaF/FlaG flagellin family)